MMNFNEFWRETQLKWQKNAEKVSGGNRISANRGRAPAKAGPRPKRRSPANAPRPRKARPPTAGGGHRRPSGKTRKTARPAGRPWLRRLFGWAAVAVIWCVILGGIAIAYFAYTLPDIDHLTRNGRRPGVQIVAADGSVFASYGEMFGQPTAARDLPPALIDAVLATEDRRFYDHFGIDPLGLARAFYVNYQEGRVVQGGSTITQQVAKNVFLSHERTLTRKVQEVLLALWLEHRFEKDEILTIYLNRVYFGAGAYGVDAAARRYFGKSARELNLLEAAVLAGMLKAPTRYNPASDPALALARADQVLANMVAAGRLTPDQAEAARALPIGRGGAVTVGSGSRYFSDWVRDRAAELVGFGERDLVILTTFDPDLQLLAEQSLALALDGEGEALDVGQGALVAMAPDGAVRAMVGGRAYAASSFNRAVQARRQPGSAFKPIVYLAGLEAGIGPDAILLDGPVTVEGWQPRNFTRKYRGEISAREALALSLNTTAVRVAERAGRGRVIAAARRLGLSGRMNPRPSLALGSFETTLLELTGAYAAFTNGGLTAWPYGIREVRDREGRVLYRRNPERQRAMKPGEAAAMTRMLAGVIDYGTGKSAQLGAIPGMKPPAGKTGTSQGFRDAWFIGYAGPLVAGIWLGNDDGAPMQEVGGGGLPARVWADFMTEALLAPTASLEGTDPTHIATAPGRAG